MSAHTAFLIAVILAGVGVAYAAFTKALGEALLCASLGFLALGFVIRT